MNISKEDFKKLKQSDRIEYLLLNEKLEREKPNPPSPYLLIFWIYSCITIPLLWFSAFGRQYIDLLFRIAFVMGIGFKLIIIFLIIRLMIYLIKKIIWHKKLKELKEEYFKIEVK